MSMFDEMEDAWLENDCRGAIEDYHPGTVPPHAPPVKVKSTAGRSRSLLSLSRLEEFATWAVADGFTREPTKGFYEVLRLRWPGHQPYIFFKRDGAQHATSQSEGTQLVNRWLNATSARRKVRKGPSCAVTDVEGEHGGSGVASADTANG